jgi:large subunit ribosomal protein L10
MTRIDFFIHKNMPASRKQKEESLKKVTELMKSAKSVVFANYQGMTMKEIEDLRQKLEAKGGKYNVAKKTIIKIAAKEIGYNDIPKDIMAGPIGVAYGLEDEIIAAKIINDVAKKNKNLKLMGALMGGKVLSIAETKQLAMLPSKDELLAKFVYLVRYPVQGFHGVLHGTIAGFVRALKAISEKGGEIVKEVVEAASAPVAAVADTGASVPVVADTGASEAVA